MEQYKTKALIVPMAQTRENISFMVYLGVGSPTENFGYSLVCKMFISFY